MDVFETIETVFLDMLQPAWYMNQDDNTLPVGDYQPYEYLAEPCKEGDYVFAYSCTDMSNEGTITLHNDSRSAVLQEAATFHSVILNTAPLGAPTLPVIYKQFGKVVKTDGLYSTLEVERTEEIPVRYNDDGTMEVTTYQEAMCLADLKEQEQQNALNALVDDNIDQDNTLPQENFDTEEVPQEEQEQQHIEKEEPFLDIDYAARGRRRMKEELFNRQKHAFYNSKENYTPPSFKVYRPEVHDKKHGGQAQQQTQEQDGRRQTPHPQMEQLLMEKELLQHLVQEDQEKAAQQQAFSSSQKEPSSLEKLDTYTIDLELEPDNVDSQEPELTFEVDTDEQDSKEQDNSLTQGL